MLPAAGLLVILLPRLLVTLHGPGVSGRPLYCWRMVLSTCRYSRRAVDGHSCLVRRCCEQSSPSHLVASAPRFLSFAQLVRRTVRRGARWRRATVRKCCARVAWEEGGRDVLLHACVGDHLCGVLSPGAACGAAACLCGGEPQSWTIPTVCGPFIKCDKLSFSYLLATWSSPRCCRKALVCLAPSA